MKLYSDIFISKPALTNSMFVYLTWKRNGKELKTVLEYKKAEVFFKELEKLKVEPHIVFESSCPPRSLS